jgi:hypothetical protein
MPYYNKLSLSVYHFNYRLVFGEPDSRGHFCSNTKKLFRLNKDLRPKVIFGGYEICVCQLK